MSQKPISGINGFQAVAFGKDNDNDDIYDEVIIAYRGFKYGNK